MILSPGAVSLPVPRRATRFSAEGSSRDSSSCPDRTLAQNSLGKRFLRDVELRLRCHHHARSVPRRRWSRGPSPVSGPRLGPPGVRSGLLLRWHFPQVAGSPSFAICLGSYRSTPHSDHGMSWERVSSRSWVIGPFRVGRGPDWGDSCEGSGVSRRLAGAVVTLSPAGAVVSRKTSASRRRSKAA